MAYKSSGLDYIIPYSVSTAFPTPNELYECLRKRMPPVEADLYLRTQAMVFRFTFIADTLNLMVQRGELKDLAEDDSYDNLMLWSYVTRLLKLPINQYDFNAFDAINSMKDFTDAMNRCLQNSANGDDIWHIATCSKPGCKQKIALDHRNVVEFERRDAALPWLCCQHGGDRYAERIMLREPNQIYSSMKPRDKLVSAWC